MRPAQYGNSAAAAGGRGALTGSCISVAKRKPPAKPGASLVHKIFKFYLCGGANEVYYIKVHGFSVL